MYNAANYYRLGRTAPRTRTREVYRDRLKPRLIPGAVEILELIRGATTITRQFVVDAAAGDVLRIRVWKTYGPGTEVVTIEGGSSLTVRRK